MNDYQQPNKTPPKMTLERLEQVLDIYGADLSRMPVELKGQVNELIEKNQAARTLYQQAAGLDQALDNRMPEVNFDLAALEQKIMLAVSNKSVSNKSTTQQKLETDVSSATILDLQTWKKDHRIADKNRAAKASVHESSKQKPLWKSLIPAPYVMGSGLIAASLISGIFFGSLGGAAYIFGDTSTLTIASLDMTGDLLYLSTDDSLISDASLSLLSDTMN